MEYDLKYVFMKLSSNDQVESKDELRIKFMHMPIKNHFVPGKYKVLENIITT